MAWQLNGNTASMWASLPLLAQRSMPLSLSGRRVCWAFSWPEGIFSQSWHCSSHVTLSCSPEHIALLNKGSSYEYITVCHAVITTNREMKSESFNLLASCFTLRHIFNVSMCENICLKKPVPVCVTACCLEQDLGQKWQSKHELVFVCSCIHFLARGLPSDDRCLTGFRWEWICHMANQWQSLCLNQQLL